MTDIPEIIPTFTEYPPTIDGSLDDACWRSAGRADGFFLISARQPASHATSARVCYTAQHLFVAFECLQPRMQEIVIEHFTDENPVWQDESVEVLVAPYAVPDGASYHHFCVNAAGARAYLRPGVIEPNRNWRCAVSRGTDRWFVEMAIPFSTLRPSGRNEDCWRINFCRNARPPGESSSWSAVPGSFLSFWRFGRLLQPSSPVRFTSFRSPLVRIEPASASVGAVKVAPVPRTAQSGDLVVPQPRKMRRKSGVGPFTIAKDVRILIAEHPDATSIRAAEELNEELQEVLGFNLPVARVGASDTEPSRAILIGRPNENAIIGRIRQRECRRTGPDEPYPEGYVIDVNPQRVVVAGSDSTGTFWGVETLKQIIRPAGKGGEVPPVFIRDWPELPFRGVHLLACKDGLSFHGKMMERVLSRFKINHIVLQTDKVAWESHPEVRDPANSMPTADVRKLVELARRHFIQVTPLVQSPGHLEWAFRDGHNLDIAEDRAHPYSYCPSNPRSYEFIFSIIDEAFELFGHPPYFHAGRDEFDMEGRFPVDQECARYGKQEMYVRDTLRIYEHLRQKGCRMMMWGDILLGEGYKDKIARLPRDILICDWQYDPQESYPSIGFFREHGFEVVACTWYDPRNIYRFSRYAARRKATGMLQTTWNAFANEPEAVEKHPEQLYAYILAAAWSWNPSKPPLDETPYEADALFREIWFGKDESAAAGEWFAVDLGPHFNISTHDSGRSPGWLGQGKGNDLRKLPTGAVNLGGTPFLLPQAGTHRPSAILLRGPVLAADFPTQARGIQVGRSADTLHFLHTTAWPDAPNAHVGHYVVRYQDGRAANIPLVYGQNISCWAENDLTLTYGTAWRGKTADGRAIRLKSFAWRNPHPEKPINSVDFISAGSDCAPVLLAITGEWGTGNAKCKVQNAKVKTRDP